MLTIHLAYMLVHKGIIFTFAGADGPMTMLIFSSDVASTFTSYVFTSPIPPSSLPAHEPMNKLVAAQDRTGRTNFIVFLIRLPSADFSKHQLCPNKYILKLTNNIV